MQQQETPHGTTLFFWAALVLLAGSLLHLHNMYRMKETIDGLQKWLPLRKQTLDKGVAP